MNRFKQYRHNVGEDNADAHLKRQVMGREVVVAVTEGKLDSVHGNRFFMANLTADEERGFWSRLLGNRGLNHLQ